MKRLFYLGGCLGLLGGPFARSAVLVHDPFLFGTNPEQGEYVAGDSVQNQPASLSVLGFQDGPWAVTGSPGNEISQTGLGFSNSSGTLLTTPGSLRTTSGRAGHLLASSLRAPSSSIYMSFLIQSQSASGYHALELHDGGFDDGNNRRLQLAAGESAINENNFVLRVDNDDNLAIDLGPRNTAVNLFVLRMDFGSEDTITVWRNPADFESESGSTANGSITGAFTMDFDRISYGNFGGGAAYFDEIRVGTNWESVLPFAERVIPEPSTVVLFWVGLWGLLRLQRHITNDLSLQASDVIGGQ